MYCINFEYSFFSNYVKHINDIRDTLFLCFERQRIQKRLYRAPVPWDITSKYKHKIKKNVHTTLLAVTHAHTELHLIIGSESAFRHNLPCTWI